MNDYDKGYNSVINYLESVIAILDEIPCNVKYEVLKETIKQLDVDNEEEISNNEMEI